MMRDGRMHQIFCASSHCHHHSILPSSLANRLQDMWAGGSILTNISDTVVAINLENGAHHSDLYHRAPSPDLDTPDVTEAFNQIQNLLAKWLNDIKVTRKG